MWSLYASEDKPERLIRQGKRGKSELCDNRVTGYIQYLHGISGTFTHIISVDVLQLILLYLWRSTPGSVTYTAVSTITEYLAPYTLSTILIACIHIMGFKMP